MGWLVMVAFTGFIMRLIPLAVVPGVNFEYLLHAHSHLAFLGWVYNALFIGLIWTFIPNDRILLSKYNTLFWFTQAVVFCMLIAFIIDGYQSPAIATLAIHTVFTYVFIIYLLKDSKGHSPGLSGWLMRYALLCLFISSLGPFAIPVIQTNSMNVDYIKLAVNFYLHFQYNGWFVLGLLAIIFKCLPENLANRPSLKWGCILVLIGLFPAYFLSVQWIGLPVWLRGIAGLAGILQFVGTATIVWTLIQEKDSLKILFSNGLHRWLLFGFIIFVIKSLFLMLSIYPEMYETVFHSRNIMVAYLHWHFLGFITLSLLIVFAKAEWLSSNGNLFHSGLTLFTIGFLMQEIYLFTQGLLVRFGIIALDIHFEILLIAAVLLLIGVVLLSLTTIRRLITRTASPYSSKT